MLLLLSYDTVFANCIPCINEFNLSYSTPYNVSVLFIFCPEVSWSNGSKCTFVVSNSVTDSETRNLIIKLLVVLSKLSAIVIKLFAYVVYSNVSKSIL